MALLVHYKLDSNANDFGPNGINLTENGSPTYTTGAINNGITLTESKYINSTSLNSKFDNLTDFTFMFRAKFATLPATGNYDHFFDLEQSAHSQGTETIRGYLQNDSGSYILYFFIENNSGSRLALSYNLTSNSKTWHTDGNFHEFKWKYDYTYPGTSTLTLFVDNTEIASNTTTSDIKPKPSPTSFSLGRNSAQTFDGVLDEVRFYNHVLTTKQDYQLYNHTGVVEFTVEGIDYTFGHTNTFQYAFINYDLKENSIYKASELFLNLIDQDRTIVNGTDFFEEVKIFIDGTCRFTGLLIEIDRENKKDIVIDLYARDYWEIWNRAAVTTSYENQTRSAILSDIAQNNQFLKDYNFGVSKIQTTVDTISLAGAGDPAANIALAFATAEGFTVYIDENKDVIFRPQNFEDTGVTLDTSTTNVYSTDYYKKSEGVVNVVPVRGRTSGPGETARREGIAIIYEDDALIEAMNGKKAPMHEIVDSSITTRADAVNRAIYEIEKRNSIPQQLTITVPRNLNLNRGKLVTITDTGEGITAVQFYILSAEHSYRPRTTKLELVYYSRTTVDQIKDVQATANTAAQPMRDTSTTVGLFKVRQEELTLQSFVTVESQNFDNAQYGEFGYGTKYYGQIGGSWSSVISDEQMTVTDKGIENFLRLIGQVTTVPTDYSQLYMALGTGTSAIAFGDTTLDTEVVRVGIEAGFAARPTDATVTMEFIIDDIDQATASFTNIGLFDASSSGNLIFAHKFASAVSKTDETALRFTVKYTLSGTTISTAALNLLADLSLGYDTNYLNNSNAHIEITASVEGAKRDAMDSGFPGFKSGNVTSLTWQSTFTTSQITAENLNNNTFTSMDLYNASSSGTKVIDATVVSTTISSSQDLGLQFILKVVR